MGPVVYVKHLISEARLPFTAAYLGSIGMTLYSAVGVRLLHTLPIFPSLFSIFNAALPRLFWARCRFWE